MDSSQRIRLARRHAGLSQQQLARLVGVQRAAVSQWEAANGKNPNVEHLRALAVVANVQFEWLATGRGTMQLPLETRLDTIAAASGTLVEDEAELRLLRCFRRTPMRARIPLLELAEIVASPEKRTPKTRSQRKNRGQSTNSACLPGEMGL